MKIQINVFLNFLYMKLQVGQYAYGYKVLIIIFHQLDISMIINLKMRTFLDTSISNLIGYNYSYRSKFFYAYFRLIWVALLYV